MAPIIKIPNNYFRSRKADVDLLVIHAMGEWIFDGEIYLHCTDFLQEIKLSAHGFCLPDGRIIESVDTEYAAYHARSHNDRSIGMEFLVEGGHDLESLRRRMRDTQDPPYTRAQYEAGGWWFRQRAEEHGLTFAHVTTHAQLDPGRKEDPGPAFDMNAFKEAFENA
jgi:N-acetyl-anhydromuramyl-L-alanine amidase AmpD